jgi:hypothetical protein
MDTSLAEALRTLGVPAGSDQDHVSRAYHRLARTTHPDVSTDPDAAERFAHLTAAYRLAFATAPPARTADAERDDVLADHTHPTGTASGRVRPGPAGPPVMLEATYDRRPVLVAGPVRIDRHTSSSRKQS